MKEDDLLGNLVTYLVTEGALRITDSNTLDRGGMSWMDSGRVSSSGWVIFKKMNTAASITAGN